MDVKLWKIGDVKPYEKNQRRNDSAGSLPAGGAKDGVRAESSTGRAPHPPAAGRLVQTRSLLLRWRGRDDNGGGKT